MRTILALAATFFALNAQAVPASPESVETLLAETRVEATIDSMYGQVEHMARQNMLQATQGRTVTAEQQQAMDTALTRVVALLHEELSWDKLKPRYVQLYCETFDQDEVDGLIAFYATPAGQAYVNKMPIVMQKSLVITQSLMQSMLPKMAEIVRQSAVGF